MWKKTIYIIFLAILSGCVSQDYKDSKSQAQSIQKEIEAARSSALLENVSFIDRPPAITTPITKDILPGWLKTQSGVRSHNLPLSVVLSNLLKGTDVEIWFDQDVDPNTPVQLTMQGTRQSLLNVLGSQTDYGFIPVGNKLEVRRYLSENFVLNIPTGQYSGQQGSKGASSNSEDNSKVDGQYINVTYNDVEITGQVAAAIRSLLRKDDGNGDELIGAVEPIPSLTALAVRTTPSRMAQVRQLFNQYQQELSKQVLLDIRILEFRSNLDHDQGIDWNLVRAIGEGTLNFVIPGTNATTSANSYGLAFEGVGKWDGTTALIKALEQQGTVSTETPISFLTLSSQPGRISQTTSTPYLSDISTEITDTTTSTSTTRGEVVEGVDMMVNANVQDDFVWLRTNGKLTKIASDTRETVNETQLRFIGLRSADLNFTNKLRYGQTVVIGSIKQASTTASRSSSFGLDGLGSQVSNRETVETLVLMTPRKVL